MNKKPKIYYKIPPKMRKKCNNDNEKYENYLSAVLDLTLAA
jgi:hypothetical protein